MTERLKEKLEAEEPEEWKRKTQDIAEFNGGNIEDYEQAVFLKSAISSYLWDQWKKELTSREWEWAKFNRFLSFYKRELLLYLLEDLKWETVVKRIKKRHY